MPSSGEISDGVGAQTAISELRWAERLPAEPTRGGRRRASALQENAGRSSRRASYGVAPQVCAHGFLRAASPIRIESESIMATADPRGMDMSHLFLDEIPPRAEEMNLDQQAVVYVVDDEPRVLDSLRFLIETLGLKVVAYPSAQAFLDGFDPSLPGCLVLDVSMPGMSGMELQERLIHEGVELPVIFLTSHGDVPMAVKAIQSGAVDFLEKPVRARNLLNLVQKVVLRDIERSRAQSGHLELMERYQELTPRQREVMQQVVIGNNSREIGLQLEISCKTVEAHRASIMKKMAARSVAQLVHMAHLMNLPATSEFPMSSDNSSPEEP